MEPAQTIAGAHARRIVLIDFDWQDADLLPELLARPEISVRLVSGEQARDPGLRMAELCDLPVSTDLADLTREIFDLAIVSERSPRRTQVEGLLLALGTPCVSPEAFAHGPDLAHAHTPAVEAPLALHAAALETTLGGDLAAIVEHALPDVAPDAPTAPQPLVPTGRPGPPAPDLNTFPSLEDRGGLEHALAGLVADTGAQGAELRAGRAGAVETVARVGAEDPLLHGLIGLALELNAPQVVTRLTGPQVGKAWGAWPFRTTRSRGVLAAAAIDPASGWTTWQKTVEELRSAWDERDRAQAAPAFPLVPEDRQGWLDPEAFRCDLDLAVERNKRDGLSFAVHRFEFPGGPRALDLLCARLPDQLRGTDRLCRPAPDTVLVLTTCTLAAFEPVRRRLATLWEAVWQESGGQPPAPPFAEKRAGMSVHSDADRFLLATSAWLAQG
ncbi:MAG: hypothetical protein HZC42_12030 [Candidatus Eisenbacteria bacterium]|nr:hypothetical protein [Candidatus Eisenbacteria bacterium]